MVLYNSASALELPKVERRLPARALTVADAKAVLTTPGTSTPLGLRDRAMLEVLHPTGVRRSELAGLCLYDFDIQQKLLEGSFGGGCPAGVTAHAWERRHKRHCLGPDWRA